MIRSTTSTLKFTNTGKLSELYRVIEEYRRVVGLFVDILWEEDKISSKLEKEFTDKVETWLSARMVQCCGKQASGIVRGTRVKNKRREFIAKKLEEQKLYKKAKNLRKIIEKNKETKPDIKQVCPELDSRFVQIDLQNETSFDGWLHLSSLGDGIILDIPFKKSEHFNRMLNKGELKGGVRLSKKQITFLFEIEDTVKKDSGLVLGIDIGQKNTISCSNGHSSQDDIHGWNLTKITEKMCGCKKGSKGFERGDKHRKNYINWSINRLNLDNVKEVRLEKIKNMRKGRRTNRMLSHWTYTDIFCKLESKCEELGVQVSKISPTYTSKRCSECGWTRRVNRNGKEFKCRSCGFTCDSDLNASRNIALPLVEINYKNRHLFDIRTGFYWKVSGEEIVVPLVQKTESNILL